MEYGICLRATTNLIGDCTTYWFPYRCLINLLCGKRMDNNCT